MDIQSPLNYTGGKFKLLPQIKPYFPKEAKIFVDLFGGGFNVGANVDYPTIVYNEYDTNVFNIVKGIYGDNKAIERIDSVIKKYSLSKTNRDGFLLLRKEWNESKEKDWVDLYALIVHSFNYSIRFNKKGGFNMTFGKDKSEFNPKLRQKFVDFSEKIKDKNIFFYNEGFEKLTSSPKINSDYFFYVDPPYLITTATYNESDGWGEDSEKLLYEELDKINDKGAKFALSNVIEHKGRTNEILKEWMKKYNVHYLNYNYGNCSYQGKNTDKKTIEVLITNY